MFELRNLSYAFANVRRLPRVRRAMAAYRKSTPRCEYCGRSSAVHVHHVRPVSVRPDLAADSFNMMTLCAKRCHLTIGHMGNWRTYNAESEAVCELSQVK